MKYWYDCEFLEDGRTIDLISIGIVAEDDRELYLVNQKVGKLGGKLHLRVAGNSWLMQNVVPGLPLVADRGVRQPNRLMAGEFHLDHDAMSVVPLDYIRKAIRDFIQPGRLGDGEHPDRWEPVELWAWCGAYDHVALMQLFGSMVDKPSWLPFYTRDFQHLLDENGITDDQLPNQAEGQHNALADAKHLRFMMTHMGQIAAAYCAGADDDLDVKHGRRVSVPPE